MSKSPERTALVTGAAGMLGRTVVKALQSSKWSVTQLVRQRDPSYSSVKEKLIEADITDQKQLDAKLGDRKYQVCIHCAAITDLEACETVPFLAERTHVLGTKNVLDTVDCKRFVYISTDSVFDGAVGNYDENQTPSPVNTYARTKLAGEMQALRHSHAVIARLNLYDIRNPCGSTLAEWAYKNFAMGQTISGYNNIHFNPLHTAQIARTILALINIQFEGTVHIGCTEHVSKFQFLQQLARNLGYPDSLVRECDYQQSDIGVARPLNTTLDTTKLQSLLRHTVFDLKTGMMNIAKQFEKTKYDG